MRRRQGDIDLRRQSVPTEIVQYIQKPNASPIGQRILQEIQRPGLVGRLRYRQRLRGLSDDALAWLDPEILPQLAVDAIHVLVIPGKPFHVPKMQENSPNPQSRQALVILTKKSAMTASSWQTVA